jgi:hypothetical protein
MDVTILTLRTDGQLITTHGAHTHTPGNTHSHARHTRTHQGTHTPGNAHAHGRRKTYSVHTYTPRSAPARRAHPHIGEYTLTRTAHTRTCRGTHTHTHGAHTHILGNAHAMEHISYIDLGLAYSQLNIHAHAHTRMHARTHVHTYRCTHAHI